MTWTPRWLLIPLLLLALGLGACAGPVGSTPSPSITVTPPQAPATLTSTPAPPTVFRVWLPPSFDPNADHPAANLLRERLEAFAHAEGLALDVRLKRVDGPGGMLPTLTDAELVAPDAVPTVLLLPRWALESAALKGLLTPFGLLPQASFSGGQGAMCPFAVGLGQVQGVTYGLLVGGEAFVMLHPPDAFAEGVPATWDDLVANASLPWRWAAGDPQARLLLGAYRAAGGPLRTAEGRPTLDPTVLTSILGDFAQLAQRGLLVPALLDLTTDQAAWEYYGQSPSALLFLPQTYALREETPWQIALIPGAEVRGWAWADGYLWAVPRQTQPRLALAGRWLAQMNDPAFLAPWTEALGLLPPNQATLAQWQQHDRATTLETIASYATPLPSMDLLTTLGPVLQEALAQVLQGSSPEEAAQQAVQALPAP
ncbi:MAG TPA: hypothetical protein G4O04_02465 [Anaerolineae bacterium]|nr:hypothetical protein [Anaerolineae bacterium]HID85061.1 hypothetical protein [Anaerolineales bacterium]HIQ08682.1 hypothetical protein [Anaerolineaceae bacterium]